MARMTVYDLEGKVGLQDKDFMAKAKRVKKAVDDLNRKMKIDAGLIRPTKEYTELGKKVAAAEKRVEELNKEQAKQRQKHTKSDEYKRLEKDIISAEKQLDALIEKQISIADLPHGALFNELDAEIERGNAKLTEMKENLKAMAETGATDEEAQAWFKTCDAIDAAEHELAEYRAQMGALEASGASHASVEPASNVKELKRRFQAFKQVTGAGNFFGDKKDWNATALSRSLKSVYDRIVSMGQAVAPARAGLSRFFTGAINDAKGLTGWLSRTGRGFGTVFQRLKKFPPLQMTVGKGFAGIAKHAKKMKKGLMMGAGIKGLVRLGAAGAIALYSIRMMKEGMGNLIAYDTRTANSVNQLKASLMTLKNALATAFAPVLNVVAPILNTLIGWLSAAATAVAHFIAALTGQSQVVVAKKIDATSSAFSGAASSASDANDAAQEYQRTLMGFDQINKLEDNSGSGGSGGGGGGGGGGLSPSDMFETVNIDSKMANWADKVKEAWAKADFTEIGAMVAEKLNTALANIPWEKIQNTCNKIAKSIGTFINGFVETFDWALLAKSISLGIETAAGAVSTLLETIHWQSIGKAVVDFICGIDWKGLFTAGSRLAGNIAGAIAGVIAGAVEEGASKIGNYFTGKIEEAGGNVVLGILKGITDAVAAIPTWIKDHIFTPFIDGFKNAFGISSPSTVMAEQGKYIIEGLLNGIKNNISSIVERFKQLPGEIAKAIGNIVLDIKSSISNADAIQKVKDAWNGIKAGTKKLVAKAKVSKQKALAKIKDTWKAFSGGTKNLIAKAKTTGANALKGIKDKWNKIKGGTKYLTVKMGAVWNNVKDKFLRFIGWKAGGGVYSGGSWKPIQGYAGGGSPSSGQAFIARENGKPELVGTLGGHTAVMNNDQIVASVSAGVAAAMEDVMRNQSGGDTNVYLQGDMAKLFKVVQKMANDYTRATGQPAFPV